jgi:tetratricopeptide (TPR) repeat protein
MAEDAVAEDAVFQGAVDALRRGDKVHAREALTDLLKTEQSNATYWVWLSAAVDTTKERIYCLQTALKLEPDNGIARRGLILLGALPPDENIQPFPLNRPRAWEEKLLLSHEKPKEKGLRATMSSPVIRLAGVAVLGIAVCGFAAYGLMGPRNISFRPAKTNTPGPSPTFTLTPTFVNAPAHPTRLQAGVTPLAVVLGVSYTPTPLYVNTPRSPISQDMYSGAKAAYNKGNWDEFIRIMKEIAKVEPDAADVPYYIGEAYRFEGDCRTALDYYNDSLKKDKTNTFAAGYLGLARARLCSDPGADVTQLYGLAISADPSYGDAYLDRANFRLGRKDFNSALIDLDKAGKLMPASALVQLAYARAYLLKGDNAAALAAARKANSIDLTLLPSYYYLASAYVANGQDKEAIKPLGTYLTYETEDDSAYALLGQAEARTGAYQPAIQALTTALELNPNQVRSYTYLGLCNLELDNLDAAETNYKKAIQFFPDSFDANIGLTQTFYKKGQYGSAYLQAEASKAKAADDTQLALAIYWRALSQEGRGSIGDAIKDWKTLLSMPASAMTAQMRQTAQEHLKSLVTPTSTPKGGVKTPTPTPTRTPTPTKTP